MAKCYINQPAGIGDIFFLQKMAAHYRNQEYEVHMLIYPHLMWLKEHITRVIFDSVYDPLELGPDDIMINTHTADVTHNDGRIMSSKYSMVGLSCDDWADYFHFTLNAVRERQLYELLGLQEDSRYIVRSTFCGTPPDYLVDFGNIPINNPDNLPIIDMHIVDGYTIFDWAKVLENAERIFTVNTSTNYILEKLQLKAKEYVIYAKNPGNLYQIDYLFKKGEIRCL